MEFDKSELVGPEGFKSAIFLDHDTNEYIMAFAGTEDLWLDGIVTDIGQASGKTTSQYRQAREISLKLSDNAKAKGRKVSFTGHSLGGGLASFASFVTGEKATTFNAAGISPLVGIRDLNNELMENGVIIKRPRFDQLVNAFYVEGEVLSRLQDAIFGIFPDANGRRIPLDPGTSDIFLQQHRVTNVCRAFGSYCDYE